MKLHPKDVLMQLIGLGSASTCLWYWVSGSLGGFRLREKLPPWAKRAWKLFTVLSILSILGGGAAIAKLASEAKSTMLVPPAGMTFTALVSAGIPVPPAPAMMRLKLDEAKRKADDVKQAHAQVVEAIKAFTLRFSNGEFAKVVPKETRQGPFCHVSCEVHHGSVYDRETLPEICKANWIPSDAEGVPGWDELFDKFEIISMRPGPASDMDHGDKFRTYWK